MLLVCLLLIASGIMWILSKIVPGLNKWVGIVGSIIWIIVATIMLCGIDIDVE